MDTTTVSGNFFQNGWAIYLISFLMLVVLYFVQKYTYLIDRELNQLTKTGNVWEGKPWPMIVAILLGIFTLLYNVLSPNDIQSNPTNWHWPEWTLAAGFLVLLIALATESFYHFGKVPGLIRFLIFAGLSVGFYFAGLYAGLLIVLLLAFLMLAYFIRFWRKRMKIN